jgi:hypothetical protein
MKPGNYVIVKEGVWDSRMPTVRRDGIILEMFGPDHNNPDQITVLFCNGEMLKFHKSQLSIFKTKEEHYL